MRFNSHTRTNLSSAPCLAEKHFRAFAGHFGIKWSVQMFYSQAFPPGTYFFPKKRMCTAQMSPCCGFGLGSWITTSSCSWFWWALLQRVWSTMSKAVSKPTLFFLLDNISAFTVCKWNGFCTRFNFVMDCYHQARAVNTLISPLDIIRRFFHWCCRNRYQAPKDKFFLCVM